MEKLNKLRPRKNGNLGRSTNVEKEISEKGVSTVMPVRKKGAGVRAWLLIDAYGGAQVVEAGKHTIMKRACLPARDLRMLDPLLSYPSSILGRERAIVVNIEHIKAIITANEVLLLNSKDPLVAPFVVELQRRLPVELGQQIQENVIGATSFNAAGHKKESLSVIGKISAAGFNQENIVSVKKGGPNMLPFEFRALEVCLEAACSCLDVEATALEQQTYPALDALTSKISTSNLERVRHIKSRLVAISGRVQKVRDEIEQLLDDDEDMAEMYLSDKMRRQQLEGTLSPGYSNHFGEATKLADTTPLDSEDEEEGSMVGGLDVHCLSTSDKGDCGERVGSFRGIHKSSNSTSSTSNSRAKHLDVEELEMLLEAYFVHIDGTLNKLSALKEYVDDTEDYINIMLDDKQNHLLKMGVMLSTATLAISAFIVVTGVFGMNIKIPLFDDGTVSQFLCVVFVSGAASLLFYVLVIGWCKWKRLI